MTRLVFEYDHCGKKYGIFFPMPIPFSENFGMPVGMGMGIAQRTDQKAMPRTQKYLYEELFQGEHLSKMTTLYRSSGWLS